MIGYVSLRVNGCHSLLLAATLRLYVWRLLPLMMDFGFRENCLTFLPSGQ